MKGGRMSEWTKKEKNVLYQTNTHTQKGNNQQTLRLLSCVEQIKRAALKTTSCVASVSVCLSVGQKDGRFSFLWYSVQKRNSAENTLDGGGGLKRFRGLLQSQRVFFLSPLKPSILQCMNYVKPKFQYLTFIRCSQVNRFPIQRFDSAFTWGTISVIAFLIVTTLQTLHQLVNLC